MAERFGAQGLAERPYTAAITREQFLFYEMRTTAQLLADGCSDEEAAARIVSGNLFQYPTEKSLHRMALACLKRLHALEDDSLVQAIAEAPAAEAKQICLYAMMKEYRLMRDFMVTVIGEKYRLAEVSFGRADLNRFFLRLQEQDDVVASWGEATVTRLKQVMMRILIETGYIDSPRASVLQPVWLYPRLEQAIRAAGDEMALPAFHCFS